MPYFVIVKDQNRNDISCQIEEGRVELNSTGKYGNDFIASVHEDEKGRLQISLGVETNFVSDDGSLRAVGWNGCEENILSYCYIWHQGGAIIFKPGSAYVGENYGKFDDLEIKIQIVYTPGMLIPRRVIEKKKPFRFGFWRRAS